MREDLIRNKHDTNRKESLLNTLLQSPRRRKGQIDPRERVAIRYFRACHECGRSIRKAAAVSHRGEQTLFSFSNTFSKVLITAFNYRRASFQYDTPAKIICSIVDWASKSAAHSSASDDTSPNKPCALVCSMTKKPGVL